MNTCKFGEIQLIYIEREGIKSKEKKKCVKSPEYSLKLACLLTGWLQTNPTPNTQVHQNNGRWRSTYSYGSEMFSKMLQRISRHLFTRKTLDLQYFLHFLKTSTLKPYKNVLKNSMYKWAKKFRLRERA